MKELYTRKLYWGKWTHKITLDLGEYSSSRDEDRLKLVVQRKKALTWIKGLTSEFKTLEASSFSRSAPSIGSNYSTYLYKGHEYFYNNSITIFFKDESIIDKAKSDHYWKSKIKNIEKPYNGAHLKAIEKEKLVVRKTLLFDRYRFVARMKPVNRDWDFNTGSYTNAPLQNEMEKWILGKFGTLNLPEKFKYTTSGYYNAAPSLYFTDANDAMLFRLTFGQDMKVFERVKLYSELDDE